jgi:hypothetical protein
MGISSQKMLPNPVSLPFTFLCIYFIISWKKRKEKKEKKKKERKKEKNPCSQVLHKPHKEEQVILLEDKLLLL